MVMNPTGVWAKLLAILALFLFSTQFIEAAEISLKDAYRSALEKTENVPIGLARVKQTEARADQARSFFLPTLALGASYQQQDTSGILSRQSSSLFGGRQSYTRLTLSQSVFAGGRDYANWNATQARQEIQERALEVSNYALFTNVAQSFYSVLSNQQEAANLKIAINLAKDRIKEIKSRTKIGRSRNIERLAAEAQLSVLEAQYMAIEGQLVTAWDQFVLITGLQRDVTLIKKRETPEAPKNIENYLGLVDTRPDIAAIKAQIESASSQVSAAKAGHLPSIDLSGNYYITRDGTQKGNNWDAGATLSIPLFTGGLVSAQVSEASATRSEAEYLLGQTRRQAEIAIRTAYNNLRAALNQVTALESALRSSEQNYKEQEKNYRYGQATNLDVIQALNSFQDTKRTLDRTRYVALSAWAQLKAATAQVSLAKVKRHS